MNVAQIVQTVAALSRDDKYAVACAVNEQSGAYEDLLGGFVPLNEAGLDQLLAGYTPSECVRMAVFAHGSTENRPFNYSDDLVCIGSDGNLESWTESNLKAAAAELDNEDLVWELLRAAGLDPDAQEVNEDEFREMLFKYIDLDSNVIDKLTRTASARTRLIRREGK